MASAPEIPHVDADPIDIADAIAKAAREVHELAELATVYARTVGRAGDGVTRGMANIARVLREELLLSVASLRRGLEITHVLSRDYQHEIPMPNEIALAALEQLQGRAARAACELRTVER